MGKNSQVEWRTAHGAWGHLEYPVNGNGSLIRWSASRSPIPGDPSKQGFPKWRCKWCQKYITAEAFEEEIDWDLATPCNTEECQILFELTGGERNPQ